MEFIFKVSKDVSYFLMLTPPPLVLQIAAEHKQKERICIFLTLQENILLCESLLSEQNEYFQSTIHHSPSRKISAHKLFPRHLPWG